MIISAVSTYSHSHLFPHFLFWFCCFSLYIIFLFFLDKINLFSFSLSLCTILVWFRFIRRVYSTSVLFSHFKVLPLRSMKPSKHYRSISPNNSVGNYLADSPIVQPTLSSDSGVEPFTDQSILQEFWKVWNYKEPSLVIVPKAFFQYEDQFPVNLGPSSISSKQEDRKQPNVPFTCTCGCGGNNNCCVCQQSKTVVPKRYECSFPGCHYSTIRKSDMTIHIRTHTGEKPFKCPYANCNYAAVTKSILGIHLRTHTGEKPLKCPYPNCSYSSANHSNLKVHMRTHTGEKPFRCTFPNCSYASITSSDLKKHLRTHTHEKSTKS